MLGLTILSPHRDDAAFSLGLALGRWSKMKVPITVLNFFTISGYGPRCSASSVPEISALRAREDRRALWLINRRIQTREAGLRDAPVRLDISLSRVTARETAELQSSEEVVALASEIRKAGRNLVLAPLGLGCHIDHRAIHAAALKAARKHKLGFYEDLPYASWTSEDELAARIAATECVTQTKLKPVIIREKNGFSKKLRIASCYKTQIVREEAAVIANYARRFGGGERLWIPRHEKLWSALLS